MRTSLAELPPSVGHETLRLRMSALLGREDALLEPTRFARMLRQAHDAEVADVRRVGEDEYEVMGRGIESAPVPVLAGARAEAAPAATEAGSPAAPRGGVRARRGSRLGAGPPAIPMVGIVSLEEEAPPAAEEPAQPKGRRKKAAKPAEDAGDEAPPKKKRTRKKAAAG